MIYHQDNLIYTNIGIKQEKNMPNEVWIDLIFKNDDNEYPLFITILKSKESYLIDTTVSFDDIDVEVKYSTDNEIFDKICSLLHDKYNKIFYEFLDRL